MYTGSVCVLDGETAARQTQASQKHTGATSSPQRFTCVLNLPIGIIITGGGGPGVVETPDLADRQQVPVTWTW